VDNTGKKDMIQRYYTLWKCLVFLLCWSAFRPKALELSLEMRNMLVANKRSNQINVFRLDEFDTTKKEI
jgi:hypothetical protein